MIVPMIKYSFLLYYKEYEGFLAKLQELGLVDITVSGWEPTDEERKLMLDLDRHKAAMVRLGALLKREGREKAVPFATAEESFANYITASAEADRLEAEIVKTEKEIADLRPWGQFSTEDITRLKSSGVELHFFTAFAKEYNADVAQWSENYIVEKVAEENGVVYFVIVTAPGSESVAINALEVKTPDQSCSEKEVVLNQLQTALESQQEILERCAETYEGLKTYGREMKDRLHLSKVNTTALREVEGTLVVMEGWATEETQEKVDAFLDGDDSAYVVKEKPTEEDEPPVLLKNNKFARLFEIIGGFYTLPKYGTMDLTPYFAPFYMIFFGFCLADAGYGLLYVIGALIARTKVPQEYKPYASLVLLCGLSTMFFGLLTGNCFGIELAKQPIFEGISKYIVTSNGLFMLSLVLGIIQILFGMLLRAIFTAKIKGFIYACPTLGWMLVILSGLAVVVLPNFGITAYNLSSVPFWIVTGIGLFGMFFLNSPGKNPFANFGLGLWNTYNDITGLLSDVLSYIRLFALGLSGGILALVFNKLAVGMSPDIIIVKQIVMILILAVGQGLTLFMASLSAFVHPLRLTFVEFYKNAGFEPGGRAFDPLKKG